MKRVDIPGPRGGHWRENAQSAGVLKHSEHAQGTAQPEAGRAYPIGDRS